MMSRSSGAEHPKSSPDDISFVSAVLEGLSRTPKTLPSRYFYDRRGSELFEEITRLPEYYLTRVETDLLSAYSSEMTGGLDWNCVLVEFGSGSSRKTELLLRHLPAGAVYAPIDVSSTALEQAAQRIASRFPKLSVWPIVGDFCTISDFPYALRARPKIGFFPGSTIGNLRPAAAARLLSRFRRLLGPRGRLIIGIDLKKDIKVLEHAYNDSNGVTAEFNLNILARINREIEPTFDLEAFRHNAFYNRGEGRMEMHLVSRADQHFKISGREFFMKAGESIHTENSYKYAVSEFQALAETAGWAPGKIWIDGDEQFCVHELV